MIRVLVFIFIFFNFIDANNIFEPLFPKGEKIQNFILNTPLQPINNLMSHSENFLITFEGNYQTKLRIWDIKKKKIIFQLNNINSDSKQLALSKDDRYLIYDDNSQIVLFDIKQKKIKKKIKIDNIISSFDISNDGKYIVISTSNELMLYEIKINKFLYKKTSSSVKQIIISKKNDYFTLLNNKYIKLIELKSGKELFAFSLENIKKIDISKDEKFIVAISDDTIYKLNILDKTIDSIDTKGSLQDVKVLDNKLIITAGRSHLYGLNIWNLETKEKIYTINSIGSLKNISLSNDNKYLSAIEEYTTALYIINMFTLKIFNLNGLKNTKKGIYSKETEEIFSIGNNEKGIKVWDLKNHKLETILDANSTIKDIFLSKDKKLLVASSVIDFKDKVKIWDIKNKKLIFSFEDKDIWDIDNISLSTNNNLVAYLYRYRDYKIKILDVNKSQVMNTISLDKDIFNLMFLDNDFIILQSYNNTKVIDIRSGKIINEINEKKKQYLSFYSNPKFYSIKDYAKGSIEIRETLTNRKVCSFEGYILDILDIVENLVFINDYKEIRIWDLNQKKYIKPIKEKFYKVYSYANKIELRKLNDNMILSKIYQKENNHWLIEDVQKKLAYRYMNRNLYLNSRTFDYVFSTDNKIKKNDIDIFVTKNELELINYQVDNFDIQIENLTDRPIYDISFRVDDENFSIVYSKPLIIEPHSIKKTPISIQFNNKLKSSFSKDVNLEVLVNGLFQKIPLNVNIIKKDMKEVDIISVSSDINTFKLEIKNLTNYNLNDVKAFIYYDKNNIFEKELYSIDANSTYNFELKRDRNLSKTSLFRDIFYKFYNNDLNITIHTNLFNTYHFNEKIEFSSDDFRLILMFFILIPFVLIFFLYQMIYLKEYNRFIKKIENNPSKIFEAPFDKLNYYRKILKRRIKRYKFDREENKILNKIFDNDFDRVARFFEVSNMEKAQIISDKVNGKLKKLEGNFFEIILNQNFELSLESFLLYFPNTIDINSIFKILEEKGSAKPIILIGQTEKEQKMLNESDLLHKLPYVLGLSPKNLKIFLLKQEHTKSLAQIFATRLDRKLISPYQEEGQLRNESYFFGREKIIHHIYSRELSNYFIVGARQIGKSSLLKRLESKFKSRDDVICFSFQDTRYLLKDIARALNIDRNSSLEEIEFYIADSSKTYLFLIDEADEFVKNEKNSGYKTLQAFRSLTQKGKAYFIMAGYYELFSQISFDYHSPIKNFGETISLGKLESKACVDLVKNPMDNLGLYYQNIEDRDKIITQTGQRANLIAMVCNDIVKNLNKFTNEIRKSDIDKALECSKVRNTHYEWNNNIYRNQRQSYITQIIVYASVRTEYFTLKQVVGIFDSLELNVSIEEIRESLQLLELMYILDKSSDNIYRYTIPLLQKELQKEDEIMLERVVYEFKNSIDI